LTDVFVAGGGPAGLAVALAARRKGFSVAVADPATPPVDKACGEGIMPDGLAAARDLGMDLHAIAGAPFRGIRFRDSGASVQADFPSGPARGIRRIDLHRAMLQAAEAAGVRMLWGTRVHGISSEAVDLGSRTLHARWIVGADGGRSAVRAFAGLHTSHPESLRFGFRRHYRVQDPGDFMEVHWGDACQLYLTPVGPRDLCAVVLSRDPQLRLDEVLPQFPEAAARLAAGSALNRERGGVSVTRRLRAVTRGNVALVGDASGSVDAITGNGICLLFQQALVLADAMEAGNLGIYQAAHRKIGRRPAMMSNLMLLLDRRRRLRNRAIGAMAAEPRLFESMLAMHVGALSLPATIANGVALGWKMIAQ
jgi:flavin-dependent dehydrogenase